MMVVKLVHMIVVGVGRDRGNRSWENGCNHIMGEARAVLSGIAFTGGDKTDAALSNARSSGDLKSDPAGIVPRSAKGASPGEKKRERGRGRKNRCRLASRGGKGEAGGMLHRHFVSRRSRRNESKGMEQSTKVVVTPNVK